MAIKIETLFSGADECVLLIVRGGQPLVITFYSTTPDSRSDWTIEGTAKGLAQALERKISDEPCVMVYLPQTNEARVTSVRGDIADLIVDSSLISMSREAWKAISDRLTVMAITWALVEQKIVEVPAPRG